MVQGIRGIEYDLGLGTPGILIPLGLSFFIT